MLAVQSLKSCCCSTRSALSPSVHLNICHFIWTPQGCSSGTKRGFLPILVVVKDLLQGDSSSAVLLIGGVTVTAIAIFRKAVKAALAGLLVVVGASAFDDPEQMRTEVEQRGTEILNSGLEQLPPESQENARSLLNDAETEVRSWLTDDNINDLFDRLSNGPTRLSDAVESFDSEKGVLPTEIQPIFNTDSDD